MVPPKFYLRLGAPDSQADAETANGLTTLDSGKDPAGTGKRKRMFA